MLLPSDLIFCPVPQAPCAAAAMEQHAVRQDDGHYLVLLEEVEAMQQEGKSAADFCASS